MDTKNIPRPRGRPRRFDPELAVDTAMRLFREHGYDAVSVADVTDALGINPPSFYAAFGSKAGLYARVLDRYAETEAIHLSQFLRSDRSVEASLAALLEEAARRYGANPSMAGCLVVEGTRCNEPDARQASRVWRNAAEETIRNYIAARYPDKADGLTDFVGTTMVGLSANARDGYSVDRLVAIARLAGKALTQPG